MAKEKFNWASVGGRPANNTQMQPTGQGFDWASVGGHPKNNELPQRQDDSHALPRKILEALGGGITGLAQGGSDLGANIAQFPSDVYSYLTGKQGYTAPKPDIRSFGPQSEIGKEFEKGGEFAAPFVLSPGLAAETMLGKTMYGGKLLPRLITDALLGSAESENRGLGAGFGLAAPAIGGAIRKIKETPLTEARAVKKLNKARKLAGDESLGIPMSVDFLRNMEYQLQSPQLKPSKMAINTLMGEAAKGDYPSYFKLQSALGDIGRELTHPATQTGKGFLNMISNLLNRPQTSATERLTGQQLNELKNRYIQEAMEHLSKTGKEKIAKLEKQGRQEYGNYKRFLPYRNKIALTLGAGIPGVEYLKHLLNH